VTDAVTHLRAIREQWGDLLAAIEQPPVAEWPPRELKHTLAAVDTEPGPQVGRLPLTLREHPAPLNLDALDAAMEIERVLFDLADGIAADHQQPVATLDTGTYNDPFATIPDPIDASDADRWNYPSPTSPGSRAFGLHWCAVWLERAFAGENPLCSPLSPFRVDQLTLVAALVVRDMARALGRDGRTTVLPAPCPWCHGQLTARTTSGDPYAATVTCGTGPTCTAPTPYDTEARRTWHGRDLVQLYGALTAARSKETAA
jgi:hypothetical protein